MYSLFARALTYTPTHNYRIYPYLIFFNILKEKRPQNPTHQTCQYQQSIEWIHLHYQYLLNIKENIE
jgi:hypothetical protein